MAQSQHCPVSPIPRIVFSSFFLTVPSEIPLSENGSKSGEDAAPFFLLCSVLPTFRLFAELPLKYFHNRFFRTYHAWRSNQSHMFHRKLRRSSIDSMDVEDVSVIHR